jgi:DNA-binding ferritin-like protein (Dps family)
VTVFRNILDRLIFNDEYETIEKNLTDSNVGGRRGRNIRDNIFVLNAIINSVKRGKEEPCDVTVNDVDIFFDSLWVQECMNTMFEYGLTNDKLVLLYEET